MTFLGSRHSWPAVLLAVAVVPLWTIGVARAEQAQPIRNVPDPAWGEVLAKAADGDFAGARRGIDRFVNDDPMAHRVADWLDEHLQLEESRRALTQADYDKYVARSKKWHERGKIARALEYALLAYSNTSDKDAFREELWLKDLRADALIKAKEHREKSEWLDAHAVYYELSEIFERDKQLKRWRRECLVHARLEEVYKKKSKWKEGLENIDPDMVTEALWRVDQKYVAEADFRKLTESGLRQVLLLARSPTLQKLFDFLKDESRRQEFEARLKVRLGQVEGATEMNRRQAVDYFRYLLKINRQTVQLPEALIVAEFMNGALDELDDFTSMIWPIDYKEFHKHTEGHFIGVGISIRQKFNSEKDCKEVVVVSPLEDSPAYSAGVQADDVITKVNGESLCELDISLNKTVKMITGPEGTSVTLTIYRPAEKREIDFPLTRKNVRIQSVKGVERDAVNPQKWDFMLDEEMGIGYARVVAFQGNTVEELHRVIADLKKNHNLQAFILDLRFNPGGLLTSAVQMAELFLGKGEKIVSTRGLRSKPWPIHAESDGPFKDLRLVVLVNEGSASASEIVAGAVKDHNRGAIVGERTFGKFSVQNLIQLVRSDAHLKLTTAHYYLPSGRCLHRDEDSTEWGVDPDVEVAVVPKEIRKIWDIRLKTDVLGPQGRDDGDEEASAPDASEGAETDEDDQSDADKPKPTTDDDQAPEAKPSGSATKDGETKDNEPKEDDANDANDAEAKQGKEAEGEEGKDKDEEEEEDEPDPNNRPEIDPQLLTALLVTRLQLVNEQLPVFAHRKGIVRRIESDPKTEQPKVVAD